jgi:hypothetical protein
MFTATRMRNEIRSELNRNRPMHRPYQGLIESPQRA